MKKIRTCIFITNEIKKIEALYEECDIILKSYSFTQHPKKQEI